MQDLLQVQPLYALTTPLLTFPADARPHRVLVADSSIYVLDSGRQAILRYRYDPSVEVVVDDTRRRWCCSREIRWTAQRWVR